MPDFETSPIGPLPAMLAGVMPTSDSPGVMMPGQFGSDDAGRVALGLRVGPRLGGVADGNALGDHDEQRDLGVDGLDHRALGEGGRHERDGHVRAGLLDGLGDGGEDGQLDRVAVGVAVQHRRAGLAGVHAADDLRAGLEHECGVLGALAAGDALDDDLGVLVEEDRHVAISPYAFASSAALSAPSSMVSASVTSGWLASRRIARPSSTLLPSRRTTSGLEALAPELGERADDALGDGVARGDSAEDVHEDALDLRVAEDDVQARGHDLGRGAAADVEEVGGLHAAVVLAGVGDDVEGRHHQARAVADDSDLAVELDVVEVVLLGLGLERVGGILVFEERVTGVTEVGVLIERDLAVQGDDVALFGQHERVDLDERRVLALVDGVELDEHVAHLVDELGGEARRLGDLDGLLLVDAGQRVDRDAGEGLGALDRELLDLHAALDAAEREVRAVRAVQQHREVVLLVDAGALRDHDALDDVTLDVQAEDGLCRLVRLVGGLRDLDAAGLAAAAGLDLGLDDDHAADLLGRGPRLFGRVRDEAGEHRNLVLLEEVACLVFVQIHSAFLRWGDGG